MNVLFIYPNVQSSQMAIPLGIASLSGFLKNYGHKTALFDTTFYKLHRELDKVQFDFENIITHNNEY